MWLGWVGVERVWMDQPSKRGWGVGPDIGG